MRGRAYQVSDDGRVVYVTGAGRIRYCSRCGAPEGECACRASRAASSAPRDGFVRLARDRKGRGGKTVTTITGVPGSSAELAALAQTLKKFVGSGGTVTEDGVIELQGDVRDRVEGKLVALGFRVKRVGG
jgi:translation initiation factor 1